MKNLFEIREEVTVIFLKRKDGTIVETLVDTSDLDKLIDFKNAWYAQKPDENFYARSYVIGKAILLHRYLTNAPNGMLVDHINGNTLDNRQCNLRIVTEVENQQNRKCAQKNCKSGIRGVCWDKQKGKWRVDIVVNKKHLYFGSFEKISDAENASKEARKKHMTHSVS